MVKNKQPQESNEALRMSRLLEAHTPQLSKKQKKEMLLVIVPRRKMYLRPFALAMATFVILFTVFIIKPSSVPNSHVVDSPSHKLKNTFQAIQDAVVPVDFSSEESESNNDTNAEKTQPDSTQEEKTGSQTKTDNSDSIHESEATESQQTDDADDDGTENLETETTRHQLRDACKAALDNRKRNGEQVNSDEYKTCDRL